MNQRIIVKVFEWYGPIGDLRVEKYQSWKMLVIDI